VKLQEGGNAMSAQGKEDVEKIQALLAQKDYRAVYDQYAPVLQDMLFVQSMEEWLDFIRQEGRLEEEILGLYVSARQGECLLLGCYEGEVTEKVLGYLKDRIPAELWEKLGALAPIIIDIDERNGTLEKQIVPYQEVLESAGFTAHIDFEDVYCAGAYFLSVASK